MGTGEARHNVTKEYGCGCAILFLFPSFDEVVVAALGVHRSKRMAQNPFNSTISSFNWRTAGLALES